jgi:hypothetical protein
MRHWHRRDTVHILLTVQRRIAGGSSVLYPGWNCASHARGRGCHPLAGTFELRIVLKYFAFYKTYI